MQNAFTHWWSTKPWDPVTGLSEYQFRMYSPELGRWLSRDPIGERGGRNLYGFVGNNPIRRVDPWGLAWGNFQAVWHFYFGGGQDVTLQQAGLYGTVTAAVQPKMNEWKDKAKQSAEDASSILACPSPTLTSTMNADSVGMPAVVFWMGGYSFHRKYFCSVQADCSKCSYSYKCTLNYDVSDEFVNPSDFDNSDSDPWDDWQYGGSPYSVTGHWDDEVTGGGKLK
jgi:RHS repeat-associated protein